jgi:hypothetical protein
MPRNLRPESSTACGTPAAMARGTEGSTCRPSTIKSKPPLRKEPVVICNPSKCRPPTAAFPPTQLPTWLEKPDTAVRRLVVPRTASTMGRITVKPLMLRWRTNQGLAHISASLCSCSFLYHPRGGSTIHSCSACPFGTLSSANFGFVVVPFFLTHNNCNMPTKALPNSNRTLTEWTCSPNVL